jgi:alkylhydroperoxidase family enzyme
LARTTPGLDEGERLVVEYAIVATERQNRLPGALFARLRRHFTEAQIVKLALCTTLCGFFNKFNDALQIEAEPQATERFAALAE